MSTEYKVAFMQRALQQAEQARGMTAPNPAVGAVLVRHDKIINEGYHRAAGQPHAEVEALKDIDMDLGDAVLYVTLEPCCHQGRTPPCTDLIIKKKVGTVYFSMLDPNPEVAGKGMQALKDAGIKCEHKPLQEVDKFYKSYRYWRETRRPWVNLKIALSSDRKVAGVNKEPVAITGAAANNFTHQMRRQADAILTTVETVINDDPSLNVRLEKLIAKPVYVLDRNLRLPFDAKLFTTAKKIILLHAKDVDQNKRDALIAKGVRCIELACRDKKLSLIGALDIIGNDGCHELWVEVGPACFQNFVKLGLANSIFIYCSEKKLGPNAYGFKIFNYGPILSVNISWQSFHEEVLCQLDLGSNKNQ